MIKIKTENVIKDAIHGYIEFNKLEMKLLDTNVMQRLRDIKQLGFANLVYPSATHTRFEHSLGTFEVAKKFCDSLELNNDKAKKIKIAGLLHDIGHGPFSHTSEEIIEDRTGESHEATTVKKIKNTQIKDILAENGYRPEEITELITGQNKLSDIISGKIDADRIDYLQRDAHYTGVAHGTIESDTIIRSATMREGDLVFEKKGLLSLESLLVARYLMIPTIMIHHTSEIAEKMLQEAIKLALEHDLDIEHLKLMKDRELISYLKDSELKSVRDLIQKVENRNLYKRGFILYAMNHGKEKYSQICETIRNNRNQIIDEIVSKTDIGDKKLFLNIHGMPTSDEKDTKVLIGNEVMKLGNISPIVKQTDNSLINHLTIDFYTPKQHKKEVYEATKKTLNNYLQVDL